MRTQSLVQKRIDLLEHSLGCPHISERNRALQAASASASKVGTASSPTPVLEAVYGSEAGRALSRPELGAALGDLIIAAADTTTNTLQFALHLVASHPDKQARLVAELRRELPPDPHGEVMRLSKLYELFSLIDTELVCVQYLRISRTLNPHSSTLEPHMYEYSMTGSCT